MGTRRVSSEHGEFTLFFTFRSPFSNFYSCQFNAKALDDRELRCHSVEQYYMYNKAINSKDEDAAERIMKSRDPREIKRLGSGIRDFDRDRWNRVSGEVMERALWAKFSQDRKLRKQLFMTHGSQLVECSPTDTIWGIGLSIDSDDATNPKRWLGDNRLGNIMTDTRKKLWKEDKFREDRREAETQLEKPGAAVAFFEEQNHYTPMKPLSHPSIARSDYRVSYRKRGESRSPPRKQRRYSLGTFSQRLQRPSTSPHSGDVRVDRRKESPDSIRPSSRLSSTVVKVEETSAKKDSRTHSSPKRMLVNHSPSPSRKRKGENIAEVRKTDQVPLGKTSVKASPVRKRSRSISPFPTKKHRPSLDKKGCDDTKHSSSPAKRTPIKDRHRSRSNSRSTSPSSKRLDSSRHDRDDTKSKKVKENTKKELSPESTPACHEDNLPSAFKIRPTPSMKPQNGDEHSKSNSNDSDKEMKKSKKKKKEKKQKKEKKKSPHRDKKKPEKHESVKEEPKEGKGEGDSEKKHTEASRQSLLSRLLQKRREGK